MKPTVSYEDFLAEHAQTMVARYRKYDFLLQRGCTPEQAASAAGLTEHFARLEKEKT